MDMRDAIFYVGFPMYFESQASVKVLQMCLRSDDYVDAWPLMHVVINTPLHQFAADLSASCGGGNHYSA